VQTGKRLDSRIDDEWVDLARRVERALRHGHTNEECRRLTRRYPHIMAALHLAEDPSSTQTWELKARLLTDEPLAKIAERMTLPLATVEAFEALFFNVRGHLHARAWIATQVIGPGLWVGFEKAELGKVWMTLAYQGGPCVLEVVMAVTLDRELPPWLLADCKGDRRLSEAELRFGVKRLAAALTQQSTRAWQALLRLHTKKRQLEGRDAAIDDVMGDFLALVERIRKVPSGSRKASVLAGEARRSHSKKPNTNVQTGFTTVKSATPQIPVLE
jgi:hypothetical protein